MGEIVKLRKYEFPKKYDLKYAPCLPLEVFFKIYDKGINIRWAFRYFSKQNQCAYVWF